MDIRPLAEEDLERFIDELWLPSQHEMAARSAYTLADQIRQDGITHRKNRLPDQDSITYLAHRETVVGYVTAEVQTPPPIFRQLRECHINELYVRKEVRRQGVASELLAAVEEWAGERDCDRLDLNVHAENRAAVALYEKEGYGITGYTMKKQTERDG